MRIGIVVNQIETEQPNYTSTCLAMEALRMGHEVAYIAAGDFDYDGDDHLYAHAHEGRKSKYATNEAYLGELQSEKAEPERISVEELDVLLLRNDPATDIIDRPWAHNAGVIFGQIAAERGVIVLNDPTGLAKAMSKLYFQQFPAEVRPRTVITRESNDIKRFIKDAGGTAILKPLNGSGGTNVFKVTPENLANLNQMIEAIARDGYVVAQEYLPAAEKGDTRFFLINGVPFEHEGKFAAMQRVGVGDDVRNNMHSGGKATKVKITDTMLRIAEVVRPKLVRDGMFLVGLDIAGDKLMEINVFSPGGLYSISKLQKVNFLELLIHALERKVEYERVDGKIDNVELAVL